MAQAESGPAGGRRDRGRWKRVLGWVVLLGGLAAFLWGLWHQIDVGECGGTGLPECPPESNAYIPAVVGGVLVVLLGGRLVGAALAGWVLLMVTCPVMLAVKAFVDRDAGERGGLLLAAGLLAAVVLLGLVLVVRLGRQGLAERRLRARGAKARGRVLRVRSTGLEVNHDPQAEIQLRLEPLDGGESFEVRTTRVVDRLAPPRIGDLVAAWYDPADRSRWTVELPGAAGPDPATVRAFGLDEAAETASDEDREDLARVAALERLATLRDSGALSDEEFEQEKQRLLD